jgi:hypothetical protein
MDSKYRAEPMELCTYCEVCRRKFDTREQFERGCQRCASVTIGRPPKPKPSEWIGQE